MLKLKKCLFIFFIIIICFFKSSIAKPEECNNIVIEGGEQALRKIFNDFNEIKDIVKDLKLKNELHLENDNVTKKDMPFFDVRCDKMSEKCETSDLPIDCATATACTKRSGIYKIQIDQYDTQPFHVACDDETETGDWLVIQKRQDGSEDFQRNWLEYEEGFGDINGEFFIGLKKLHALTNYNGPQELLIVMEDANGTKAFAKYNAFAIGNETESYKLKRLGKYSGTAGDSLQYHVGMKFTTKDRDNNMYSVNCAVLRKGAWWYRECHQSNLNGHYKDNTNSNGINWKTFRGYTESLPYVKMMIRRSRTL